ncbi:hypothetical protein [Roseibium sp.]|uniref:hypothetical protein n=1 Tax=Roseibium sp. TaxID=1936156 RepID=UPI003D0FB87A
MTRLNSTGLSALTKRLLMAAAAGTLTLAAVQPSLARPNSTAMTCAQVQSMIVRNGAVVLSTGQYTFDRYVANLNYCQHGEVLYREYIPTKDSRKCPVQRCGELQRWKWD